MGILGLGRIGEAVAKRAMACGMKIRYHNRNKKDAPYPYDPDPVTLAKNSDVLMVITPGGPETSQLVNAQVLDALGPKGYLINIARGSVVDEPVLLRYLQEKRSPAPDSTCSPTSRACRRILHAGQRRHLPARGERNGGDAQGDGRPADRESAPPLRR